MKAAILGRPFKIRFGGSTDLIYADDVATASLSAADSGLPGARVYNLHGESDAIARVIGLIQEVCPAARGSLSHMENSLPFPAALADHGYQRDLGPKPRTGRLDARELQ